MTTNCGHESKKKEKGQRVTFGKNTSEEGEPWRRLSVVPTLAKGTDVPRFKVYKTDPLAKVYNLSPSQSSLGALQLAGGLSRNRCQTTAYCVLQVILATLQVSASETKICAMRISHRFLSRSPSTKLERGAVHVNVDPLWPAQ